MKYIKYALFVIAALIFCFMQDCCLPDKHLEMVKKKYGAKVLFTHIGKRKGIQRTSFYLSVDRLIRENTISFKTF